jgi:hypothetical protein
MRGGETRRAAGHEKRPRVSGHDPPYIPHAFHRKPRLDEHDYTACATHGRRSGHAAVPRHRPGQGARTVEWRATPSGVTIQVYRPAGRRSTDSPRQTWFLSYYRVGARR